MAATSAVIVLVSLLLLSCSCHAEDNNTILLQVIDAIEKLIEFYKSSYQNLNIDGLYGLRVVEGQIESLLDEIKQGKHTHLKPDIVTRLHTMRKDSQWASERAIPAVQNNDEPYFKQLDFIIAKPWKMFKPHRKIVPVLRWEIPLYKSNTNNGYSEEESDKCMAELRRSDKLEAVGDSGQRCQLSEHCGAFVTKKGMTEYSITHQLLWTMLAEMVGCEADASALLRKFGFSSIGQIQEEFCTNVYYEMLAVVHVYMSGTVKGHYQDIFMEQQFVCPSLGFYEFLKKKYLDQILSWQFPSGCFGERPDGEKSLPLPQDPKPVQRPHSVDNSPRVNSLLNVKNLDQRQQQLSQQLKDLQSNKEANKLLMHYQNNRNNLQPQILDTKKRSAGNHEKVFIQNERSDTNQGHVHQPPLNTNNRMNGLLVNQKDRPAFAHQGFAGEKPHGAASNVGKESPNRNSVVVSPHIINRPRSQNLNGKANPFLKLQGDGVYAKNMDSRPPNQLQPGLQIAQQNSNNIRDEASVVRKQGGVRDSLLPLNPNPGLPQRRQLRSYRQSDFHSDGGERNGRKLLAEKHMPGNCLSHKTSVAAGALAMYLRYLIDPGPLDLFSPPDFFPEASRSLLDSHKANAAVQNFLSDQRRYFVKVEGGDNNNQDVEFEDGKERKEVNVDDDDGDDDDEEEDYEDEEGEYDDKEELYPDAGEQVAQHQEKKVVHFGGNDYPPRMDQDDEYLDNKEEDKDKDYSDENEDEEEEEEEEGDYIKRVKGDENGAVETDEKDNIDEDTEYTYYDDEDDDSDRGIIKRHKPQAPPQKGARIRAHNRHKPHPASIDKVPMGLPDSPPTKTVVMLLSATSLLLIVFMYRFIRKRRIHIRHNSRGFFTL